MTQSERLSNYFRTIRDWKIKSYGMHISDAAADIQEFMRDCCREWNQNNYQMEYISDTKILKMLRVYFKDEKASYVKYNNSKINLN